MRHLEEAPYGRSPERRGIFLAPTREQKAVLIYLGRGYSYEEVGEILNKSVSTCKGLMGNGGPGVKNRLGVDNIFGGICYCLHHNFIDLTDFNPPPDLLQKVALFSDPTQRKQYRVLEKSIALGTDNIASLADATYIPEQTLKNIVLKNIVETLGANNTRHALTLYAVSKKMQGLF